MAAFFAFIIIIVAVIVQKNREKNSKNVLMQLEINKTNEIKRKNEEFLSVVRKIVKDRICKYKNKVYFVLSDRELLMFEWSENGDNLYHKIKTNFDYQEIIFEEDIKKSDKEYLMFKDLRYLLISLYDIIIPDVKKLEENITNTKKSINIAKNLESGTLYTNLMEKYLKTMETLLYKASDIQIKYYSFIKEICAQYEIEKFENIMSVSIIDRSIDYKNIEDNLIIQYEEYSNYRKIYEELSNELKETL